MSDRPTDERRDDPDRETGMNDERTDPDRGAGMDEGRTDPDREAGIDEGRTDPDRGAGMDERRTDPDSGRTGNEGGVDPDRRAGTRRNPGERGKWVSALIALAGLWLIVEPFLIGEVLMGNLWNDVIVGVLLVALGGYNYYRRTNDQLGSTAVAGLAALLGLWLVVSPFVYGAGAAEATNDAGFWNDVVVGLVVFGLGAYSAYETRDVDTRATPAER